MNNSGVKILAAFLAGAAIGAGLGMLFAPDKGENTRKKIIDNLDEIQKRGEEKVNEFKDKIHQATEKTSETVNPKV